MPEKIEDSLFVGGPKDGTTMRVPKGPHVLVPVTGDEFKLVVYVRRKFIEYSEDGDFTAYRTFYCYCHEGLKEEELSILAEEIIGKIKAAQKKKEAECQSR